MISDKEIWTSASMMIRMWGNTADFEACRRAAELFDVGDLEGQRVWHRILEAIDANCAAGENKAIAGAHGDL